MNAAVKRGRVMDTLGLVRELLPLIDEAPPEHRERLEKGFNLWLQVLGNPDTRGIAREVIQNAASELDREWLAAHPEASLEEKLQHARSAGDKLDVLLSHSEEKAPNHG